MVLACGLVGLPALAAAPPLFFGVPIQPPPADLDKAFNVEALPLDLTSLSVPMPMTDVEKARPGMGKDTDSGFYGRETRERLREDLLFGNVTYSQGKGELRAIQLSGVFSQDHGSEFPVTPGTMMAAFDWLTIALGKPDGFGTRELRGRKPGVAQIICFWRRPQADITLSINLGTDGGFERSLAIYNPELKRLPPKFSDITYITGDLTELRKFLADWIRDVAKLPETVTKYAPIQPASAYTVLEGEGGSAAFQFEAGGKRYLACTLAQFKGAAPAQLTHPEIREPIRIDSQYYKDTFIQVLEYNSATLDKIPPLVYEPGTTFEVNKPVYVYHEKRPILARVMSSRGALWSCLLEDVSFLPAIKVGSPVLDARTGKAVGIVQKVSADSAWFFTIAPLRIEKPAP
jgi:hypothetical protein